MKSCYSSMTDGYVQFFSCTPYSPLLPEAALGMLISLPLGWEHSMTNCLFLAEKGVVAQCVNVPKAEF